MTRRLIGIALGTLVSVGVTACKGETKTVADPQTVQDLDVCQKNIIEKDKLIKELQATNAELMRDKTAAGDIVVSIEGNVLTVKRNVGGGGGGPPLDDKQAAAASKEFIDVVAKSRGAIQKCYEQALKKDQSLQARTVTLTVSASFAQSGQYRDASFSPSLGDTFDRCMKTIASKWALPQNSPAMTFRAPVSLTPS
jgi:hypothetical protein